MHIYKIVTCPPKTKYGLNWPRPILPASPSTRPFSNPFPYSLPYICSYYIHYDDDDDDDDTLANRAFRYRLVGLRLLTQSNSVITS